MAQVRDQFDRFEHQVRSPRILPDHSVDGTPDGQVRFDAGFVCRGHGRRTGEVASHVLPCNHWEVRPCRSRGGYVIAHREPADRRRRLFLACVANLLPYNHDELDLSIDFARQGREHYRIAVAYRGRV